MASSIVNSISERRFVIRIAVLGTGMIGNTIGSKLVKGGHRMMVVSAHCRLFDTAPFPK